MVVARHAFNIIPLSRHPSMARFQNQYGPASLTASVALLLLSAMLLCSCPLLPFLSGVFAVIASILTNRVQRLVSVLLAVAGFSAAYLNHQHQDNLVEGARETVRQAEEKSRKETGSPVHESK
jgi:hypothetical protein